MKQILKTESLSHPAEIENPGDPEEIVEIVDERGYSRLVSGPIVVLRKYYFGLIRIQEPFDPQWDLGWGTAILLE